MLMTAIPDLILILLKDSPNLPFLFCTLHMFQFVGSFCCVLSLCNKIIPDHFTHNRVVFLAWTYSITCLFSLSAYGAGKNSWESIISSAIGILNQTIFPGIALLWLRSLGFTDFKSLPGIVQAMSINEKSGLLYIISTFLILGLIPGLVGIPKYFEWEEFNETQILTFIYSLTAFILIPGCLPGRVARHFYMKSQLQADAAQSSKWATLRYLRMS